jgi:hypothetical protein
MATTAKTVNYTPEQTKAVVDAYTSGMSVADIAGTMGKTVKSIVAKLSREKVYKAKEYVTKTGEKVEKKNDLADAIGAVLLMTEPEISSLTSANKTALSKIWKALASSVPATPENSGDTVE